MGAFIILFHILTLSEYDLGVEVHVANGVFLFLSIADDDGISAFTCIKYY